VGAFGVVADAVEDCVICEAGRRTVAEDGVPEELILLGLVAATDELVVEDFELDG
jgi:hypothetical protein